MLIQIKANCKNYSEVVLKEFSGGQKSKGEFCCDNPDCRCDVFYIHGTYERHFLHFVEEPELNDTVVFTLPGGLPELTARGLHGISMPSSGSASQELQKTRLWLEQGFPYQKHCPETWFL